MAKKMFVGICLMLSALSFSLEDKTYNIDNKYSITEYSNTFNFNSMLLKINYNNKDLAHPYTELVGINIDNVDKENVKLYDLFDEATMVILTNIIKKDLLENRAVNMNGERFIPYTEDLNVDLYKAQFVFDGEDLVIIFQLYELGPYSSGIPVFRFSLKGL